MLCSNMQMMVLVKYGRRVFNLYFIDISLLSVLYKKRVGDKGEYNVK